MVPPHPCPPPASTRWCPTPRSAQSIRRDTPCIRRAGCRTRSAACASSRARPPSSSDPGPAGRRGMIPAMDLASPVQFVKGVGPQRAEALAREGVTTLEDLLFHLPMRYEDRTALARIADLRPGMKVSVAGTIAVAGLRRARAPTLYAG